MSAGQWLLLILLSVLWGGSYLFAGIAVRELPVATIVLARVALAALALVPIALLVGYRLPSTPRGWLPFAGMALLNNLIPMSLIVTGQTMITSGLASVINATTPLFGLLVAWALVGERLAANKVVGVLIGIAGVAVLMAPALEAGATASVLGILCSLGAALSYGFSGLWGRRFKDTPPMVTAASQLVCSSVMLAPIALAIDRPWLLAMPSPFTITALLALALASTAFAYIIFFRIMAVSGSNNVMLVTLLIPVSGIWLGHVVLSEPIVARQIVGAIVIAVSLLVIDGRVLSLFRRRA